MNPLTTTSIVDIPLDRIRVINPRGRGKRQHRAIIESIASVGLKRPITVSPHTGPDGEVSYDLVCGQGRIEAVRTLGHTTIPARVVETDERGCLEMSLVENVARRNHAPVELLRDVDGLVKSGQPLDEVAVKVGLSLSYLQSLLTLLGQGEERLVGAVERGTLPVGLAISIARSTDTELQLALADAYADGTLKARQLAVVRRIIEQRLKSRGCQKSRTRPVTARGALNSETLRKIYVRESERQHLLIKKADMVHAQLSLVVSSLRELLQNAEFVDLLRQENLASMPRVLADRINGVNSHESA
ncbi:plasmid partitioning protein RepB C-terminal domain-containing protein [Paraburkholderia diazotrophica]|uniref:Chromosome partitioning protein, ParB family n=1 Tax=Paraburkholderia diazotrophica TaxID=667676 RepID=A0A1H7D7G9_9BURK|nr:plasmid partitioning protein RepB C-terminal domain-containing protein [Paraburkholderia diazotrophica]SEJ96797.1 chromosome partitioning protein, ParB family [Paraburkholderia diazotrophica]